MTLIEKCILSIITFKNILVQILNFNYFLDLRLIQAENVLDGVSLRQRGGQLRGHGFPEENDETQSTAALTAQLYQEEANGQKGRGQDRRGQWT